MEEINLNDPKLIKPPTWAIFGKLQDFDNFIANYTQYCNRVMFLCETHGFAIITTYRSKQSLLKIHYVFSTFEAEKTWSTARRSDFDRLKSDITNLLPKYLGEGFGRASCMFDTEFNALGISVFLN